jgi:hypothetical protein
LAVKGNLHPTEPTPLILSLPGASACRTWLACGTMLTDLRDI